MSTRAPSTPESTPRKTALNRSFTLPSKIASTSRNHPTAEIGATEGVETLYTHPNSKIVKFTSVGSSRPKSSSSSPGSGGQQNQGTLPWATSSEQTLAAGPLEIYRVPGSVSFLHSGSLLHAILPRSNCWCVDGVSKFAMRVLADTYYRIELPGDSPEELEKVEEFKETLKKVLFFERTPCPFARTFSVDLPEEPLQIRRKKKGYHGPAKKWKLEKAYSWKPEDGGEPPSRDAEPSSGSVSASDEEDEASSAEDQSDSSEVVDRVSTLNVTTPSRPTVRERARGFNLRSVTAPPQMILQSTPPSRLRTSYNAEGATDAVTDSARPMDQAPSALQQHSLRPFQQIPTDMPPSPPDSSAGFEFAETPTRATTDLGISDVSRDPDIVSPTRHHEKIDLVRDVPPEGRERMAPSGLSNASSDQLRSGEYEREGTEHLPASPTTTSSAPQSGTPSPVSVSEENSETPPHNSSHELQQESIEESVITSASNIDSDLADPQPIAQNLDGADDSKDADADADVVLTANETHDPFAQIQARIQARRSIGGTTSFTPNTKSPTRQSSTASSGSSLASSRSTASRLHHQTQQQQQAFATALVRKACSAFLGPPAHLVMIMLRIAARFAKGAFPSALLFESPAGERKRVPGSFDLDGSDVEDFGLDDLDGLDWEEDDFGVPLRSPVRLASVSSVSSAVREHLKERGTWDSNAEGVS